METSEILTSPIDNTQVPHMQQKMIIGFVNHFLISSCSFINKFATQCEEKFINLERKMQNVEAALIIVEAKLASIPDLTNEAESSAIKTTVATTSPSPKAAANTTNTSQETPSVATTNQTPPANTATTNALEQQQVTAAVSAEPPEQPAADEAPPSGIKACEDARYRKFFKMVQFGVPPTAVKLKMQSEGVQPDILDTPNLLLADGVSTTD